MKKLIKGSIILILLLWILANGCYAQGKIEIMADKQIRKKEEEISIKVRISDTQIAACTLEIYWDMENLEYLRGPENANYSNHRILYMWVSDNGEDKESLETEDFVFKVLTLTTLTPKASSIAFLISILFASAATLNVYTLVSAWIAAFSVITGAIIISV